MNNDFKQEIINHALCSAENLSMAINIASAVEDIKKQLIKKFAESLLTNLQTGLPKENGWEIDAEGLIETPFAKHSGLFVKNKNWQEGLGIVLEAQNTNYHSFLFMVYSEKTLSEDKKNKIKAELENKNSVSKNSTWPNTIWCRNLQSDLMNWDNEAALLKIYNGDALDYVVNELVSIAGIVNLNCM